MKVDGTNVMVDPEFMDESHFKRRAVELARSAIAEDDRPHPKVGAVVVLNGREIASAFRGETGPGEHAEYSALERKLSDQSTIGASVFTTLEPCTTRNHPKVPCAERLIERKVARVFVGIVDPNPAISGKGILRLREAGIDVQLFGEPFASQIEELNRDFIRDQRMNASTSSATRNGGSVYIEANLRAGDGDLGDGGEILVEGGPGGPGGSGGDVTIASRELRAGDGGPGGRGGGLTIRGGSGGPGGETEDG